MRAPHRLVLATAAALLPAGIGLAATVPAAATPHHPAAPRAAVRHLVYLTAGERIEEVSVTPGGKVSAPTRIAPAPGTPQQDRPVFVEASPDGHWLAWIQNRGNRRPLLYLRNLVTGSTTTIATNNDPVGFGGDRLLVTFNRTFRLVRTPHPHFVQVPHAGLAIDGYAGGAIDVRYDGNGATRGTLRLTSWSGHQTPLHHYTDFGQPDYRPVDQAYVSSDQRRLLVERGNHQDFDGLGPGSLVDEFSLTGHHHRTALGNYSDVEQWRVAGAAFRGTANQPYVAWEAQTQHGVRALVASYAGGRWNRVAGATIAVAADRAGDLLLQPGRYLAPRSANNPTDYPAMHPSRAATLRLGSHTHRLAGVRGIQFWFAAG